MHEQMFVRFPVDVILPGICHRVYVDTLVESMIHMHVYRTVRPCGVDCSNLDASKLSIHNRFVLSRASPHKTGYRNSSHLATRLSVLL